MLYSGGKTRNTKPIVVLGVILLYCYPLASFEYYNEFLCSILIFLLIRVRSDCITVFGPEILISKMALNSIECFSLNLKI